MLSTLYWFLKRLWSNQLFAKLSKCIFCEEIVDYLGYIVSIKEVETYPNKIKNVKSNTIKELKGFLGLTGYYRKFIRWFGIFSKPLTELSRKNNFKWNSEA
jgi:hypothetical protein